MKRRVLAFLIFYLPCFVVQAIGGYLTQQSVMDWYPTLNKSSLTPPGYVFGVAWSILYALMALAASRVYVVRGTWRSRSLVWWGIQLVLGLLWSAVFFGHREVMAGLVIIVINWAVVVYVADRFWKAERLAGALMVPLMGWLTFATYLNGFILLNN